MCVKWSHEGHLLDDAEIRRDIMYQFGCPSYGSHGILNLLEEMLGHETNTS